MSPTLQPRILIVDDELSVRFALGEFFRNQNITVFQADSCVAAEEVFRSSRPDLTILDNFLSDGTALNLMPRLKQVDDSVPIIILTGNASIDLAVRAIKEGAEHFITKPVDIAALSVLVERAIEIQRTRRREAATNTRNRRLEPDPFCGRSSAMRLLEQQALRVADAESAIVIQGETGSGKGVLANWLHRRSRRAVQPFVDLNCAGLSRDFLETELFGHDKGAFTSAIAAKPGLLEVAHRGTLFLDEIGDMDPLVQPKLLKALEEKRFRRLGEVKERIVDTRLIAATHQDLMQLVQRGRFRSDLYFRISTIPLRVPSLRDRAEDIPLLAQRLLEDLCTDLGRPGKTLSGEALDQLRRYHWPGNVRELRNVLERAVLLGTEDTIGTSHLVFDRSPHLLDATISVPADLSLEELERWYIEQVLNHTNGKVELAAAKLKIPRSSLYQKLKRYGTEFRRSVIKDDEQHPG